MLDKGVKLKDTDPEQANEYFEKAKKHYMMAAETLPKDEEFHLRKTISFLHYLYEILLTLHC